MELPIERQAMHFNSEAVEFLIGMELRTRHKYSIRLIRQTGRVGVAYAQDQLLEGPSRSRANGPPPSNRRRRGLRVAPRFDGRARKRWNCRS